MQWLKIDALGTLRGVSPIRIDGKSRERPFYLRMDRSALLRRSWAHDLSFET
jgi:hypothetical protein